MNLEKDEQGNIITHPLSGWKIGTVADTAVLLVLDYLKRPDGGLQQEEGTMPFIIAPQQALELAERLQAHAMRVLAQKTPPRSGQN